MEFSTISGCVEKGGVSVSGKEKVVISCGERSKIVLFSARDGGSGPLRATGADVDPWESSGQCGITVYTWLLVY